uniref:Uncharacterized protein n=1 Tax=Kalanchoe fedtschenkoi TaxID=63787 RepID=A0A7N0UPQ6_KALFE
MSRCFPFPPPGYEKKITATASDLLKKEKHKEKKHKKEKRDKEKREDKEKKDKDRSDGKNREKKEKKDKHRDKKKEKARDKDRHTDNPSTSGETRHKVLPEGCDGQIVNQKILDTRIVRDDCRTSGRAVGYNEENHGRYTSLARETNGVKFVQDFDRRIRGDVKTAGDQTGESITHNKRNETGGMLYLNNHLTNNFKDSDLALELDRRLKDEAEQPYDQNQINNKIIATHQRKDFGVIKSVSLNTMERGDNRIKVTSGGYIPVKSMGTTMVTNVSGPALSNHDRTQRPLLGGTSGKKIEGQERVNHQEDELQQRGMKRKDKDRNEEKKSHGKDKSRDKERKEDKRNNRGDQNRAEQGTRESHKMDVLRTPDHEMLSTGQYNNSITPKMRSLNRVKEPLTNGFHHGELS